MASLALAATEEEKLAKNGAPTADARATAAAATAAPAARPANNRMSGAAQRNENVAIYFIDNNAVKEANIRLGTTATMVNEAAVESNYFASEHGKAPYDTLMLRPVPKLSGWHGELFESHQNSVFNARAFFQVGGVKPSHRNQYGTRFTGNVRGLGILTGSFSNRKVRGMVNGNVLVPLAGERQSTAQDPRVRALINRWLEAYPNELPNRLDFDVRALNTNAPQKIDEIDGALRLDREVGKNGKLSANYSLNRSAIKAFQLVAGQNPDTWLHTHNSRLVYRHSFSAATQFEAGASFQRTMSLLVSEPNAVGPRVRFGFQIEELGPDSQFPVDRAQNTYRTGWMMTHTRGSHTFTFGGDYGRLQLNGLEANNLRGYFNFANNYGRTALQNFLAGTPSNYEVSIGNLYRGFRQSSGNAFIGDRWKVTPKLQVYYGIRYNADGSPYEIRNLTHIPYPCDCNNVAPRLGLAWRMPKDWVMRAAVNVSHANVVPVAWHQARNDLPEVKSLIIQDPDLLDPLRTVNLNDPNLRTAPIYMSGDLASAYAYQYNYSLEHKLMNKATVRVGYLGSRAFQLLNNYTFNRAEPMAGVPLTTATVDQRRANPRFTDMRYVVNGGMAYFDGGQVSLDMPVTRGLMFNARYTFSKAIDDGTDFSYTAANKDMLSGRSQYQFDTLIDRRGLSLFDSTHALSFNYAYELPRWNGAGMKWLLDRWQVSGVTTIKSGTPLTLYTGSDAPGFGNVDGGVSDRPNIVDASILGMTIGDPNTSTQILQRNRFSFVVPGDKRGSLGRGTFRKGGIANWNLGISKEWHGKGRREWVVLLRGEAYNLTNTPQFDEPQRNLTSPAFGRITNTLNDGRAMQLGLRLVI